MSSQLDEWLSSQVVIEWAAIQPPLADIDLRPYLFVTKDRKDYFGITTVLGHISAIAEGLLGPKITIQAKEEELKSLAVPEAAQVFELVRSRIVSSGSFDAEPAGVAGLNVLVKSQPTLQPNLLDFLESLPVDHLGPWVVRGWDDALKDPDAKARFGHLILQWGKVSKNTMLKAAATATAGVLQTTKRGS